MSHTGSFPRGGGGSTAVTGGADPCVVLSTWSTVVTTFLLVAIYNFVLYFINGPPNGTYTLPKLPWGVVTPHLKAPVWCRQF